MLGRKRNNELSSCNSLNSFNSFNNEQTFIRNCIDCKKLIFDFNEWKIRCFNCWKYANNKPNAKPKGFNYIPEINLENIQLFNLDTEMDSLGLGHSESKKVCLICKCEFEVKSEEENWKKKCLECFKIQRQIVPIEVEFQFFKTLFDLSNLKTQQDLENRKMLVCRLYEKKEFFKLRKNEYIKLVEVDKIIGEFIDKLEENKMLGETEKKYLFYLKQI